MPEAAENERHGLVPQAEEFFTADYAIKSKRFEEANIRIAKVIAAVTAQDKLTNSSLHGGVMRVE